MAKKKKGGKSKKKKDPDAGKPVVLDFAINPELAPDYDPLAALYADPQKYEEIHSLELENDTMKMIARELRLRLEKHSQSLTQIISHLNLEITKKELKINELTQTTTRLDGEQKRLTKTFGKERESVQGEYQSQIDHISNKVGDLRYAFEQMAKVKEEKENAEATFMRITEELEVEKEEHSSDVSALERRNVMSKEKLKNEMLQKIKETKMMLLAMTEDQLHTTTKRTIMENDQMTTELMMQSKETERLLKQNNKLDKENRSLKRQVELNDQAREMLIRRANKLQNGIAELNEQLAKRHKKHAIMKRSDDVDRDLDDSNRIVASLEERIQNIDMMIRRSEDDSEMLRVQLADSREANNRMLGLQDEALTFTLMVFESTKMRLNEAIRIGTEPAQTQTSSTLPAINPNGGGVTSGPISYDMVHSKLQGLQLSDSGGGGKRKGSRKNSLTTTKGNGLISAEDGGAFPRLTDLVTISQREAYLDMLIKKFNTYSPAQLRLITQHAL